LPNNSKGRQENLLAAFAAFDEEPGFTGGGPELRPE
jgi:hypothetical protein